MAHALQVFLNVDLRCSHFGLAQIARKEKIAVEKLKPGEFVIFINCEKDRIKLFTANNVLAYLKLPKGRIDLRTISLIPKAFQASGKIEYDNILKDVLEKELLKPRRVI